MRIKLVNTQTEREIKNQTNTIIKKAYSPKIIDNEWWVYDDSLKEYVNTGVLAKGEKGDTGNDGYTPVKGIDYFDGDKGEKGDKGDVGEKGDDYVITEKDYEDIAYVVRSQITIPSKLSEMLNDMNFIDNTVLDLANYYLKSETYTKEQVNEMIGSIHGISVEIVEQLPAVGAENTIYFVPSESATTSDIYDEYMYVNGKWEKIGSTSIDLSDYAKKSDVPTKTSQLSNDSGFVNMSQVSPIVAAMVATKEDVANKTTALTSSSTDAQYPSAKAVYDLVGNIESAMEDLL